MNAPLQVERLQPRSPMIIRARVWSDGDSDQASRFAALLQQIAPANTPARLVFAWKPFDRAYAESLGSEIAAERLPELLARCEDANIQLAWLNRAGDLALDVICDLYDDHIEVAAGSTLAPALDRKSVV